MTVASIDELTFNQYSHVLSPSLRLIHAPEYINPSRAALLNVYIEQVISELACMYDSTISMVPLYKEGVICVSDSIHESEYDGLESKPKNYENPTSTSKVIKKTWLNFWENIIFI